jgi:hypothetical protein
MQIMNEKTSLCVSKSPLDTFENVSNVMLVISLSILIDRSSDLSDIWIVFEKRFLKYFSENWYIGSISAKSNDKKLSLTSHYKK